MSCRHEDSLPILLGQISHLQLLKAYGLLEELGVHPKQVPTLIILRHHEGISQRDLVDLLRVKAPTVAVTIKRLERAGYVERRGDTADQRISRIYLTNYGKEIVEQIPSRIKQVEEKALEGFTQEERLLMRRLLLQIRENLTKPGPEQTVKDSGGKSSRRRHIPRNRFQRED